MLKKTFLLTLFLVLALSLSAGPAAAKNYKMTIVAGHPPILLWVSLARDFYIPEVNKRLAEAGGKDTIEWNQAWGGTVAKLGGCLEAIEEGIADLGFVGTIFEAPKMPLHNVTYMTPFGSDNIKDVVEIVTGLQKTIPAVGEEWGKYNQIYLGGMGLDTYGIMTSFPVNTVDDLKGHKISAPGPTANWIKGTGAVAVAGTLNSYYNDIKTGVSEGTLTFMTAGYAIKIHEVAPYITMVNFGAQFAGGLSINKDVFESLPEYMQEIMVEVGKAYGQKLAEEQTKKAEAAIKGFEDGGGTVKALPFEERVKWANTLPNIPMEWAKTMDEKGLPGTETVKGFLDGLRAKGAKLPREWDK